MGQRDCQRSARGADARGKNRARRRECCSIFFPWLAQRIRAQPEHRRVAGAHPSRRRAGHRNRLDSRPVFTLPQLRGTSAAEATLDSQGHHRPVPGTCRRDCPAEGLQPRFGADRGGGRARQGRIAGAIAQILDQNLADLTEAQELLYADDRYAVLIVFQAMDAAGKDGTIKHVMSGVNPQGCQVFSFKKPSAEDLKHNFLWRYMRCLPERGRIGIFNRSYYEDVLVVKVHPELLAAQRLPGGKFGDKFWHGATRTSTPSSATWSEAVRSSSSSS